MLGESVTLRDLFSGPIPEMGPDRRECAAKAALLKTVTLAHFAAEHSRVYAVPRPPSKSQKRTYPAHFSRKDIAFNEGLGREWQETHQRLNTLQPGWGNLILEKPINVDAVAHYVYLFLLAWAKPKPSRRRLVEAGRDGYRLTAWRDAMLVYVTHRLMEETGLTLTGRYRKKTKDREARPVGALRFLSVFGCRFGLDATLPKLQTAYRRGLADLRLPDPPDPFEPLLP